MSHKWQRDPFYCINLGRQYSIKEWIIMGYMVLLNPNYSLGARLLVDKGLPQDQIIKLLTVREAVRQHSTKRVHPCFSCGDIPTFNVKVSRPNLSSSRSRQSVRTSVGNVLPQTIAYCKCGEAVFADPEYHKEWDDTAIAMIKFVFQDELKR